jgi:hypothetical protein
MTVKENRQNLEPRVMFEGCPVNVLVNVNANVPVTSAISGTFTFTSTFTCSPPTAIQCARFCRPSLTAVPRFLQMSLKGHKRRAAHPPS